ncbi:endonuclease domain-containing 1 protein-like [Astyanax mexicanus]|uniref:Endonuclease domain containing 1 n=1 Tax=Astyanax mexicanus TaxID=7994 RepID=A0A8B9JNE9_ASTMX|nr:endonuclease domain-containing 1 protein-like [Astyanax mexicanus]
MILFTPGLLLLLLLALSGCFSEVVDDFLNKCPQFFANPGKTVCTPTVFPDKNRYKQICQSLYEEQGVYVYEYATLYDTANKIPVYSAYKFEGKIDCTRDDTWYFEPQLDNPKAEGTMKRDNNADLLSNQAVSKDYIKSRFHKGHLAPVSHARTQECSDATFTLTNAAPQNGSFNSGKWRVTEAKVAEILEEKCAGNSRYIVTGVVPGTKKINNRVCVPSFFWTAYICLDNNQQDAAACASMSEVFTCI